MTDTMPGTRLIATFHNIAPYLVHPMLPDDDTVPVRATSASEPHGYCYLIKIHHPPIDRAILINVKILFKEEEDDVMPPRMTGLTIVDFEGSMQEFGPLESKVQVIGHKPESAKDLEHMEYSQYTKVIPPLERPAKYIAAYFYTDVRLPMTLWEVYTKQDITPDVTETKTKVAAIMGIPVSEVKMVNNGDQPTHPEAPPPRTVTPTQAAEVLQAFMMKLYKEGIVASPAVPTPERIAQLASSVPGAAPVVVVTPQEQLVRALAAMSTWRDPEPFHPHLVTTPEPAAPLPTDEPAVVPLPDKEQ